MDYVEIIERQRKYFASGKTMPRKEREKYLRKLFSWIEANETLIEKALQEDLGKAPFEGYETEIGIVKEEIKFTLKHLRNWMRINRVPTPLTQFPSRSFQVKEPYGVVLIMSPWNYPFQLTVAPLVAALAAGNCAILKPSAYSKATSALLARMVRDVFPSSYVTLIEGGREENAALLEQKFDYIFFTGSPKVGRLVMEKASTHLTPVSLELGGKSPCIVDKTANLKVAAKRIVWGKFLNAGQTCVAPDYVLVDKKVKKQLVSYMKEAVLYMYGKNPIENEDYPHIINDKHYQRLCGLLEGENPNFGGVTDDETRKISPCILDNANWDIPAMQEEIFGPILPVIEFDNIDEAIEKVCARPKPLALYLFTRCRRVEKKVLTKVSFGGGCINDTIVHLATSYMPFGGVGESGMGNYHGKAGFDTFTHEKSIMKKSNLIDIKVRYAPYGEKINILKRLMG